MKRFFVAVTAFTICGSVLISSVAAHDIDGLDVTVWLSDPKLEEAVGTPFLYSCSIFEDGDPIEVDCWGAPSSLR